MPSSLKVGAILIDTKNVQKSFIFIVISVSSWLVCYVNATAEDSPLLSQDLVQFRDQTAVASQPQQLDHCRFLFQSPSVVPNSAFGNERGAHVFVSPAGRFASPTINLPGENRGQLLLQPGRVCEFAFIASPSEKVDVTFTDFDLPGHPPQCKRAYLDIVFQSDKAEFQNFVELTHENRYCGKDLVNIPHRLISLHQSIFMLMDTSAMKNNTESWRGFRGTFAFIPARPYHVGTPLPPSASGSNLAPASRCGGQLIRSTMTQSGAILSPTYPGIYGDDSYCFWRLIGNPGERIKLTFNDLGLFYGDEQCPFDFLSVYDGFNAWSPLLRTMCGQLRNGDVVLFSRSHEMFIEFVSGRGRYDSRNFAGLPYWLPKDDYSNKRRGFKATFEFSSQIVPLSNILGANGAHIAGSECDQLISNSIGRSLKQDQSSNSQTVSSNSNPGISSNSIFSPYYPADAPANISCVYTFQGRNERDYIDKIRLVVLDFADGLGEIVLNENVVVTDQQGSCIQEVVAPTTGSLGADTKILLNSANASAADANTTETLNKKTFAISLNSRGIASLSGLKMPERAGCVKRNQDGSLVVKLVHGMVLESLGPNLTVIFTSYGAFDSTSGRRRFLMQYSFVRDFHVAGVGHQHGDYICHYVFNESTIDFNTPALLSAAASQNSAEQHAPSPSQLISLFTSPHFPRPYPWAVRCVYDFVIDRRRFNQLRLWFDLFDVGETPATTLHPADRARTCRDQDHVSIYQMLPAARAQEVEASLSEQQYGTEVSSNNGAAIGFYSTPSFPSGSMPILHSSICGRFLPGPLVSDPDANGFQLVFTSVARKAVSSPLPTTPPVDYRGFRANFEFISTDQQPLNIVTAKATAAEANQSASISFECPVKQIVVGRKGAVVSPNYPNSFYPAHGLSCDWTIQTYSENAILQLMLTEFEIEGAYNPAVGLENCQNAALEIYAGPNMEQPTVIRCSSASILTGEIFISKTNRARIRFLTSPASTGGPGFRIDWNEVYTGLNDTECRMSVGKMWCNGALRCIASELRCDGIPHCGLGDLTDEENCTREVKSPASTVLIAAGGTAAILSLMIIMLVVLCRLRRQSIRHRKIEKEAAMLAATTACTTSNATSLNESTTPERMANYNRSSSFASVNRRDSNSSGQQDHHHAVSSFNRKKSNNRSVVVNEAKQVLLPPDQYHVKSDNRPLTCQQQQQQQQYHQPAVKNNFHYKRKSIEESILIDTETFGASSDMTDVRRMQLFEKITMV